MALTGVLIALTLAGGITLGVLAGGEDVGGGGEESAVVVTDEPPDVEATTGAVSPGKALMLAVAVQARDERSGEEGPAVGGTEVESPLGPTTARTMRAQYVLRLAAVAVLLRELGNKASSIRDAAGLDREDEAVRDVLRRLDAVAGGYEDSIYRRSRDLDELVAATISATKERLGPGEEERIRELGPRLSELARSITAKLERAATAAGEGRQFRADRLFEVVERRLATLERTV